jgi:hypothetical protein
VKTFVAAGSILSLVLCLAAPVMFFLGLLPEASFKLALLLASLGWFILATTWASLNKKSS